jgi:Transglutaminase elicitor
MKILCGIALLLPMLITSCGPAPKMPEYKSDNIDLLNAVDEKFFYLLPLKGTVRVQGKLWSGPYWRSQRGSINYRWNSTLQEGFDYNSPTRDEVIFMTPEMIETLSPAEKFDLLNSRYEYPLREEVYSYTNRNALDWEGLNEGMTLATSFHNEPTPKVIINPDGIPVSFRPSDIKALLSFYYQHFHSAEVVEQMGKEQDLNAGSFHVILTNKVGKRNESFIVDVDRLKEVWNLPVARFVSSIEGEKLATLDSPKGTAKILSINTRIFFVGELKNPQWEAVLQTPHQSYLPKEYSYDLYLNLKNEIIGGKWTSEDRPHFIWTSKGVSQFKGLFEGLNRLLND